MSNVVISYHKSNSAVAEQAKEALSSSKCDVYLVNDAVPVSLATREQAVQWCGVFVVVASVKYQRDAACMEIANYARQLKKPVVTIIAQSKYTPFGALGAISISGTDPISFGTWSSSGKKELVKSVSSMYEAPRGGVSKPPAPEASASAGQSGSANGNGVFVSYHSASGMGKYVAGAASSKASPVKSGDEKSLHTDAISACKVFVAVLSSAYQNDPNCQNDFDVARGYRKVIIPVVAERGFQAAGWLALGIAGKLYYMMPTESAATESFYDSNPRTDFLYSMESFLEPTPSEEEREIKEKAALQKQIDDCKKVLPNWPPEKRPEEKSVKTVRLSLEDLKINDSENLQFNFIHYEVTRMTFAPPQQVFDGKGLPIKRKFEAMCSYQWDSQKFVRDLYMDLHMANLAIWMDIWGGMQGNINVAMANAVECSACIICFLTDKYQKSANCLLELKYAIYREKPVIFLLVEPNLAPLPFIKEELKRSITFDMKSMSDAGVKDEGVPRVFRIAEAARKIAAANPNRAENEDITEDVAKIRDLLDDALHAVHEMKGTQRFETCTRCGANFDENNKHGCKKHGSYFMGGTIIAGRWVCCNQRDKTGPGCEPTTHSSQPRKLKEMPGHSGCYKWSPE